MPLPLYGSGGRTRRMLAAVCPTSSLSMPETMIRVGSGHLEVDAVGGLDHDRVGETHLQLEPTALEVGPVTDTDRLQLLAVAVGHAGDHVGEQRPVQTVERPHVALVAGAGSG